VTAKTQEIAMKKLNETKHSNRACRRIRVRAT
jgi:hypothetical protein